MKYFILVSRSKFFFAVVIAMFARLPMMVLFCSYCLGLAEDDEYWVRSLLMFVCALRLVIWSLWEVISSKVRNCQCILRDLGRGMDLFLGQCGQAIGSGEGQRCMVATCIILQTFCAPREARLRREQQLLRLPRCCALVISRCGPQKIM